MKTIVTEYDFLNAFSNYGRENQFSYHGKLALFNYLNEYEQQTGMEIELDIIAICCDFCEYDDINEIKEYYPNIRNEKHLKDFTEVIYTKEDKIIIQNF